MQKKIQKSRTGCLFILYSMYEGSVPRVPHVSCWSHAFSYWHTLELTQIAGGPFQSKITSPDGIRLLVFVPQFPAHKCPQRFNSVFIGILTWVQHFMASSVCLWLFAEVCSSFSCRALSGRAVKCMCHQQDKRLTT